MKTCGTRFSERDANDRQRRRSSEGIGEQIFGLSLTGFFLSTCSAALGGTVKLYCEELRRLGYVTSAGGFGDAYVCWTSFGMRGISID